MSVQHNSHHTIVCKCGYASIVTEKGWKQCKWCGEVYERIPTDIRHNNDSLNIVKNSTINIKKDYSEENTRTFILHSKTILNQKFSKRDIFSITLVIVIVSFVGYFQYIKYIGTGAG